MTSVEKDNNFVHTSESDELMLLPGSTFQALCAWFLRSLSVSPFSLYHKAHVLWTRIISSHWNWLEALRQCFVTRRLFIIDILVSTEGRNISLSAFNLNHPYPLFVIKCVIFIFYFNTPSHRVILSPAFFSFFFWESFKLKPDLVEYLTNTFRASHVHIITKAKQMNSLLHVGDV